MRKPAPATLRDVLRVRMALLALRTARDNLAKAHCPQATNRVRAAIASTEGALRHVVNRASTKGETAAL